MDIATRRAPLKKGRRLAVTISISPETHKGLAKIAKGNKSAAIEQLVRDYFARRAAAETLETTP